MSFNDRGRKIYRSMNGVAIELDKLIMRNETTLAVGNAKVNARGDTIGPGGKIIKKIEDPVAENYPTSDNVVSQPARVKAMSQPTQPTPVVQQTTQQKTKSTRSVEQSDVPEA